MTAGANCKHNNPNLDSAFFKQKTNIICTLGPVSRDVPKLEKMLLAGMRVARFNFSHGKEQTSPKDYPPPQPPFPFPRRATAV